MSLRSIRFTKTFFETVVDELFLQIEIVQPDRIDNEDAVFFKRMGSSVRLLSALMESNQSTNAIWYRQELRP